MQRLFQWLSASLYTAMPHALSAALSHPMPDLLPAVTGSDLLPAACP